MSKAPAFQFYPNDWSRDLEEHPLEIEGAWIRICCKLWWSETRGTMTKTLDQWARILREKNKKTEKILQYFFKNGIADGSYLDNQNIIITSRRMVRDFEISQLRREVGKLGGNPGLKKINENLDNQNESKSASLLLQSSSSTSLNNNKPPIVPLKRGTTYTDDFLNFWKAYPKKVGKGAAWKSWKAKTGTRPALAELVNAIVRQSQSDQWQRDNGQYIPNPATWLNQERWEDEVKVIDGGKPKSQVNTDSPFVVCPRCKREIPKDDLDGGGCIKCAEIPKIGIAGLYKPKGV